MSDHTSARDLDEFIEVNCGRCGKKLLVRVAEVRNARTIDCRSCAVTVPRKHGAI